MLRGQIHINLPPEHPIMSFETIEINMAAVSAKRSTAFRLWKTFYYNLVFRYIHSELLHLLGLFFVLPKIDQYKKVDLRTVSFDVPPQEVLLKFFLKFLMLYFSQSTATCIVTFSATADLISLDLL